MSGNSGDFSIGSKVWPGTSKLLEEMGELQQVLGKLLGSAGEANHWDGSDLRKRLVEEIGDLKAAIEFFQSKNMSVAEQYDVETRRDTKFVLFQTWHGEPVKLPRKK